MILRIFPILLSFCSVAVAQTAPPQAVVAGYTTPIFKDYFGFFKTDSSEYETWWTCAIWTNCSKGTFSLLSPHGLAIVDTGEWAYIVSHPQYSEFYPVAWRHGYFEGQLRVITANTADNWFAFWLEDRNFLEKTDYSVVGQPTTQQWCEIDIAEEPGIHNALNFEIHHWTWPQGGALIGVHVPNQLQYNLSADPLDGQAHTYGLLWIPGQVSLYIDNKLVQLQSGQVKYNSLPIDPFCDAEPMDMILSSQSRSGTIQQELDVLHTMVWQ